MRLLSIKKTAQATGLSQYYLRKLCREHKIKHIRCGTKIMIDLDALEEHINHESTKEIGNDKQ